MGRRLSLMEYWIMVVQPIAYWFQILLYYSATGYRQS